MDFKSQVYTTIEQSKRLIALGIKAKTADCCHCYVVGMDNKDVPEDANYPAWSLHRLMEIMYKGDMFGFVGLTTHDRNIDTIYELVIANIEGLIKIDHFNQDYLEEKK